MPSTSIRPQASVVIRGDGFPRSALANDFKAFDMMWNIHFSGGNTLIFVNRSGLVPPDTAHMRQADDRDPSATLTTWTAIGSAAANFEDLEGRSAAGAMPSLVALGQK